MLITKVNSEYKREINQSEYSYRTMSQDYPYSKPTLRNIKRYNSNYQNKNLVKHADENHIYNQRLPLNGEPYVEYHVETHYND